MKRQITATLGLIALLIAIPAATAGGQPPAAPAEFFGIAPQTELNEHDVEYMKAGGIGSVRISIVWGEVQPTRRGPFNWARTDQLVAVTARAGLRVLPFVYGTPRWLTSKSTTLPVNNPRARAAWKAFLKALVERYGPGGDFWSEHSKAIQRRSGIEYEPGVNYEPGSSHQPGASHTPKATHEPPIRPPLPVHAWQIWNEANFFYFTLPVSPSQYGKLVTISSQAIKRADPSAKVVLSGLFAEPTASGLRGMPADRFLRALYNVPGIKSRFDGIALHPYAVDAETLEEYVESFHEVAVENGDRPSLYVTEMGWGSQNDFEVDAFEQGPQGQAKQLRDSYAYLLENRLRLNLKQVFWFSWKDLPDNCNFCDSVGFFRTGPKFKAKPAWHTFVGLTGGRARP